MQSVTKGDLRGSNLRSPHSVIVNDVIFDDVNDENK